MKNLSKYFNNNKGVTTVLITLSLTAIIAFSALVTDVGLMFMERNRLVNATDAAALAGALELPVDSYKAKEVAKSYANINGVPIDNIKVLVNISKTEISVDSNKDVNFLFAKLIGFDKGNVKASSKVMIGPVSAVYDGIRPLVIEDQTLVYGQQVVLKENAGDGSTGNYGAVRLGGSGSKVLEDNITYGYKGKLEVGDVIYTETGNIAGPVYDGVANVTYMDYGTYDNYERDSKRIWIIPVVDTLAVTGSSPVTIIGFACFFVEDAYRKSGQTEITGRFIKFTTNGDIDPTQIDYGLTGAKLVQ